MPNLFMIDLLGTAISSEEKDLLQHPNVGSVILFSRNFTDRVQLKALTESITAIRPDIFIAVDHEGGEIQRFCGDGFSSLPAAHTYGEAFDKNPEEGRQQAEYYGEIMARELLECGVDLSLAPILDLHGISSIIGARNRAFHSNPEIVVLLGAAFIQGMQKGGMPAIGKHFPGHGSAQADSHIDKTTLNKSRSELQQEDLKPFSDLIHADLLAAVMPAHITYPAVDPDNPAGFSRIWLQTILRDELAFNGLVLSDCLSMKGADIGDMQTRAIQAAQAGCDMLILCQQERAALRAVLEQMESYQQSSASIKRINAFKEKLTRFACTPTLRKESEQMMPI